MNGWSIIFAATSATSAALGSSTQSTAALLAAALFGILFLLALCTKALRGTPC